MIKHRPGNNITEIEQREKMKPFQSPMILFILSQVSKEVSAAVFEPRGGTVDQRICSGSLKLISTDNTETLIRTVDYPISDSAYNLTQQITISRAKTEGCGACFIIFRGWRGLGSSRTLNQQQQIIHGRFSVKSFKRINCPARQE